MNDLLYVLQGGSIIILLICLIPIIITIMLIAAVFEINSNIKDIRNHLYKENIEENIEKKKNEESWLYENEINRRLDDHN